MSPVQFGAATVQIDPSVMTIRRNPVKGALKVEKAEKAAEADELVQALPEGVTMKYSADLGVMIPFTLKPVTDSIHIKFKTNDGREYSKSRERKLRESVPDFWHRMAMEATLAVKTFGGEDNIAAQEEKSASV